MRKFNLMLAGASFAAMVAAAPAQAQDETADEGTGLADIVVTAQKREQSLQDVPVAVTAITSDALAANRIQNLLDLNSVAPNLTVRASAGGNNLPTITMRGMFASSAVPGAEKQIGFYIDGVYVGATGGSVFDLAALERIEVLRGPQGTLFGQNATAGAISVFTQDPSGQFGVTQQFTLGNYRQRRSRTIVNLPSFGPLSAYVAYEHSERRGDMINTGAGTVWDYRGTTSGRGLEASPKYLGSENRETIQAGVKYDGGDFTTTYKFFWIDNRATPEGMGLLDFNAAALGARGPLFQQAIANNPTPIVVGQFKRPKEVNNWFTQPNHFRNQGHIVTAQWRISDSMSLKNTFGYMKNRFRTTNSLDGMGGLINSVPELGAVGSPLVVYVNTSGGSARQWSDELQFNYDSDLVTLTAGYLHYDFKGTQGPVPGLRSGYFTTVLPDFVVPGGTESNGTHTKSDAVYSQAEIHLTPKLDLILGGRYTWDNKTATTNLPNLVPFYRYKDSRESYSAGFSYKPNDDLMIYAKYSTAYVAGGAFAGWTWLPETAKSWEGGFKAEMPNRRARVSFTLFSVKYANQQGVVSGQVLGALFNRPELTQIGSTIGNVGNIQARGFEIEATAAPVDGLTLNFGMGYTDSKYTSFSDVRFEQDLAYRPDITLSGSIQYDTPPLFGDAFLRMRVDANSRSSYDAVRVNYTPLLRDKGFSPATTLVNGRVALTDVKVGPGSFELAAWGRNLTNERSLSYPIAITYVVSTTYERARTFGLDLTFRY